MRVCGGGMGVCGIGVGRDPLALTKATASAGVSVE